MSIDHDINSLEEMADNTVPPSPATGIKRFLLNVGISFFGLLSFFILSAAVSGLSSGATGPVIVLLVLAIGPVLATMAMWKARQGKQIKRLLWGLAAWIAIIISSFVMIAL